MIKRLLHRGYLRTATLQRWFSRKLTPAGQLVAAGALFSALIGADTNLNVAHLLFMLLAALLLTALITSMFLPPRMDGRRILPRFGTVGTPLTYDIHLTNRGRHAQSGLTLFENLPDPHPSLSEFLNTPEPGEEQRNIVDRQFGYYRWLWLVSQRVIARSSAVSLGFCPPNGSLSVAIELTPLRRGILRFEGYSIGASDPFGLFRRLHTCKLPQSVVILPRRYWLPPIALPGTREYQRGGVALASSVGESEEFVSLRDYRPGDPIKHIHWRSWAHVGKPIVKEFQDEFFVRHALVLDTFGGPLRHAAFEEAVSVAASFACTLQTQESLLDLMFVGDEAYCFTMGRGLAHVEQLLEILAGVNLRPDRAFDNLEDLVLQHLDGISGCIFVLVEWDAARINLIRRLQALGMPMLVLVVAAGRDAKLVEASLHGDAGIPAHVLEIGSVQEGLARLGTG